MIVQYSVLLAGLIAGTITDLKTREVPDWINYGLIAAGFGINLLSSIILENPAFIIYSILGFSLFWALSHLMYYTGQWGGGDAKMLMGIGALLGIEITKKAPFVSSEQIMVAFIINLAIAGFFYGIIAASVIAFRNREKFMKQLRKDLGRLKGARIIVLSASSLMLALAVILKEPALRIGFLALSIITAASFCLWAFVKSVENSCMYKLVAPEKLTEGDWIAKEIVIGKKVIASPKDLGIEKKQIEELIKLKKMGKIKKILIKEGIPFVPSFLIAFLMSLLWGNVLLRII